MKLRCTTNSIRIRIRKSELAQLASERHIQDQVIFPGGHVFSFALQVSTQSEIDAKFENNEICIQLPESVADKWMVPTEVGIYSDIDVENGQELKLIIEKDFPCTTRPDEDKNDTFQELAKQSDPEGKC